MGEVYPGRTMAEFIQGLAEDNNTDWQFVYKFWVPHLYGLLRYGFWLSEDDSKEAIANTVVRLRVWLLGPEREDLTLPFLLQSARWEATTLIRKNERLPGSYNPKIEDDHPEETHDASRLIEFLELRQRIDRILNMMRPDEAFLLDTVYLREIPRPVLAQGLEYRTQNSFDSAVRHARNRFQILWQEVYPDDPAPDVE